MTEIGTTEQATRDREVIRARRDVKRHRDVCLQGDRRKRVEADLVRLAAKAGGAVPNA